MKHILTIKLSFLIVVFALFSVIVSAADVIVESGNLYAEGNIGVGISGSSEDLHVVGNILIDNGKLKWTGSNPRIETGWDTFNIYLDTDNNVDAPLFRIFQNGIVGGAATENIFTIDKNGAMKLSRLKNCDTIDTDANGKFICGVDASGSSSAWSQTGTDVYYDGGDVGIGINDPKQKLQVTGGHLLLDATSFNNAKLLLENSNIEGVNSLFIADAGPNEGILWSGTAAKIYVSTLQNTGTDGYLRLINDGGISLEPGSASRVRIDGLESCDSIDTDATGSLVCGTDAVGTLGSNIPGDNIQDNTIDSSEIEDGTITGSDIADGTLGSSEFGFGQIFGIHILDNNIKAEDIGANAVGSSELASSGVTAGTYGSATQVPQITVDVDGRITSASSVAVAAGSSGGEVIVGNTGAACDAGFEGALRYNSGSKVMEYCDGTDWKEITGGASVPSGGSSCPEEQITYSMTLGPSSASSDCQPNQQIGNDWVFVSEPYSCPGSGWGSSSSYSDGSKTSYLSCPWTDTMPVGSTINQIEIDPVNAAHYEANSFADWYMNDLLLLDNDNLGNVGTTCGSFADFPDPIDRTDSVIISKYNIGGSNNIFIYKQTGSWYILDGGSSRIDVTVSYVPPSC
jgi:hypothetical protein